MDNNSSYLGNNNQAINNNLQQPSHLNQPPFASNWGDNNWPAPNSGMNVGNPSQGPYVGRSNVGNQEKGRMGLLVKVIIGCSVLLFSCCVICIGGAFVYTANLAKDLAKNYELGLREGYAYYRDEADLRTKYDNLVSKLSLNKEGIADDLLSSTGANIPLVMDHYEFLAWLYFDTEAEKTNSSQSSSNNKVVYVSMKELIRKDKLMLKFTESKMHVVLVPDYILGSSDEAMGTVSFSSASDKKYLNNGVGPYVRFIYGSGGNGFVLERFDLNSQLVELIYRPMIEELVNRSESGYKDFVKLKGEQSSVSVGDGMSIVVVINDVKIENDKLKINFNVKVRI